MSNYILIKSNKKALFLKYICFIFILFSINKAAISQQIKLQSTKSLKSSVSTLALDSDGDGVPNTLDYDSDNDGVPDAVECTLPEVNASGLEVLFTSNPTSPTAGVTNLHINDVLVKRNAMTYLGNPVDAIVKIVGNSVDGITSLSAGGNIQNIAAANNNPWVTYTVTFAVAGTATAGNLTGTPIIVQNVYLTMYDVDGNGLSAVEGDFAGYQSSVIPETVTLSPGTDLPTGLSGPFVNGAIFLPGTGTNIVPTGFTAYRPTSLNTTQGAINVANTDPTYAVEMAYENFSTSQLIFGHTGLRTANSTRGQALTFFSDWACDDDSDGIPNTLDLDSDNDGCPDSVEAGASNNVNQDVFTGEVDANGIPLAVSANPNVFPVTLNYTPTYANAINPASVACKVALTGTVFNDINAGTVDGIGTNAGGLNANLLDNSGNVIATVPVNSMGIYTFTGVPTGTGYTVQINSVAGTIGTMAPLQTLPSGWVNTGDITPAGATTAVDGVSQSFNVSITNLANINFGIQQKPTAIGSDATIVPNPGGIEQSADASSLFSGTDLSGGIITSLTIVEFPVGATSLVINGVTYTAASPEFMVGGAGVTIPTNSSGVPTSTITVDPTAESATEVPIKFVVTDNAGSVSSNTATVTLKFDAPLPIQLLNFKAFMYQNQINLQWKTSNEKSFSHFEIQKGGDINEFGEIGTINGNQGNYYNFIDISPNFGINYYRLKMIDMDGTYSFSKIISIDYVKENEFVSFINPAIAGKINLISNFKNPSFNLINGLGQAIDSKIVKINVSEYIIEPYNKISGNFYLIISSNGKTVTKKVLFE